MNNLHTDDLEQKYGPIHSVILRHDKEVVDGKRIREVKLVDQNNIMRTYALTFLTDHSQNPELAAIDEKIRLGGLIGRTFQNHGYATARSIVETFTTTIPSWMKDDFHAQTAEAKANVVEFFVQKENTSPKLYGTILEIYTPDMNNENETNSQSPGLIGKQMMECVKRFS